jgi:hypothetical protein
MTIACVVHWYESLLFLAPVALTIVAVWVTSKITERRELREEAEARPAGFEPATSSSGGTRSIQLS